jgi:hypothetical protein
MTVPWSRQLPPGTVDFTRFRITPLPYPPSFLSFNVFPYFSFCPASERRTLTVSALPGRGLLCLFEAGSRSDESSTRFCAVSFFSHQSPGHARKPIHFRPHVHRTVLIRPRATWVREKRFPGSQRAGQPADCLFCHTDSQKGGLLQIRATSLAFPPGGEPCVSRPAGSTLISYLALHQLT